MVSPLKSKLNQIVEYTPESNLTTFVGRAEPAQIAYLLTFHFLQINSKLAAFLANAPDAEETYEIRKMLDVIREKKRVYSILEKVPKGLGKEKLQGALEDFLTISSPPKSFLSMSTTSLSPSFRILASMKQNHEDEYACYVMGKRGDELIGIVKEINNDDVLMKIAKHLTPSQAADIMLAEVCSTKIPRIIVSLSKDVFFEFLIGITDQAAKKINEHLTTWIKEQRTTKKCISWFTQRFEIIREEVAAFCNKQNDKINKLNEFLRKLPVNSISKNEIDIIEKLTHEVFLAKDAQLRLGILIKGVITDEETIHLFNYELPACYARLLLRLSQDEDEQRNQKVTGCPYGILYRNAYGEYHDCDANDSDALLCVICNWQLPHVENWIEAGILEKNTAWEKDAGAGFSKGLENLEKFGIRSIPDLKRERIFNSKMLIALIKREVVVDVQSDNPLKPILNFVRGFL